MSLDRAESISMHESNLKNSWCGSVHGDTVTDCSKFVSHDSEWTLRGGSFCPVGTLLVGQSCYAFHFAIFFLACSIRKSLRVSACNDPDFLICHMHEVYIISPPSRESLTYSIANLQNFITSLNQQNRYCLKFANFHVH